MGLRIQMSRLMVFSGEDRGICTSFGGSCQTRLCLSLRCMVQAHRSPGDVVGQSVGELEH